jgi:hypothetical protein
VTVWGGEILAPMVSYAEVSPRGTSVKIWVTGMIPGSVKPKHIGIATAGRYFTVTGQQLAGAPPAIRAVTGELTALCEAIKLTAKTEPSRPLPPAAIDADHARRWCLAALDGERPKMLAAGAGERHKRRYASAFARGGLVHTADSPGRRLSTRSTSIMVPASPMRVRQSGKGSGMGRSTRAKSRHRASPPPSSTHR